MQDALEQTGAGILEPPPARQKKIFLLPANHANGKDGQEDFRARTFPNLLAIEFSCPVFRDSIPLSLECLPRSAVRHTLRASLRTKNYRVTKNQN
jgi:hypothetical protein